MKIVLNTCFGGFGLSYKAMALYLAAKGERAYFYVDISNYHNYTKEPRYKRVSISEIDSSYNHRMITCTTKDQGEIIHDYPENTFYYRDIPREDPILVFIVETLGAAASGKFAELEVIEIPDGTLYKIDEYDGLESLITQDDDDWLKAEENTLPQETKDKIQSLWDIMKPAPQPDPDLTLKY